MQKKQIHAARLAALCLGSSIFALSPAMASNFSVGGGTITTASNDGSGDLTGTGGPFILAPNGGGTSGDTIVITGVSITNTDNSVIGRAVDIGGLNPTTASYSVIVHGSTLRGSDNAGLFLGNNGGTISFDSTGGAANIYSGLAGLEVVNSTGNGSVIIRTGADTITSTNGEALSGLGQGTGSVSIDSAAATITSSNGHGIYAITGSGAITIGGLNGGIASTINAVNGDGIHVSSSSSIIHVTLASAGSITAQDGIWLQGDVTTVDSFGSIVAANDAVNSAFGGQLFLTLEQGSSTSGQVLGSLLDDSVKLITGANIAGATFNGGSGNNLFNLAGSGTGSIDVSTATNFSSIQKDGPGTWILTRSGAAGISGAAVTLNAGLLVVNSDSLSGNVLSAAGSELQFNQTTNGTYAGVISGGASLFTGGSATLSLSGVNTFTGGTTIADGTLQLAASGALPSGGALTIIAGTLDLNGFSQNLGSLSGVFGGIRFGGGQLTAGSTADTILASALSGPGTFTKIGAGTLTMSGTSSFTGATNVNAGRLNVTGSLAASNISVANGGTLGGTGQVGSVAVASGGTLSPGIGVPGTLSVTGNLTLAPGAVYAINLDPTSAGMTNVSGSANVNGSLVANAATGGYSVGKRYTVLTAAGGVSGTFSSFTTPGLPGAFKSALSYDANDVYLTLSPNALSPLLPANATFNQRAVAGGIDAALAGGATLPGGFTAVFNLSGAALGSALNQLTGEIGGDASRSASQALAPYLALLMQTKSGIDDGRATAVGIPDDVKPAQLQKGEMKLWGAAYGGHGRFGADAITGAQQLSTGAAGFAIGIQSLISDDLLIGGSLAGASETFSLAGGISRGTSSDIMGGLYMREALDQGYLSGAIVYGSHNIGTMRAVTISGTDILKGKFVADDFGGRLEGGYNFGLEDGFGLSPYAALAGENFSSPAYGETALLGISTFALSYAARETGLVHSELGTRLGRDFGFGPDALSAEVHAAWAHQIQDDLISQARFQALAGSNFAVASAALPEDSGLLGLDLTIRSPSGVSGGAKVESRFGAGFTAVSGSVSIGYSW